MAITATTTRTRDTTGSKCYEYEDKDEAKEDASKRRKKFLKL